MNPVDVRYVMEQLKAARKAPQGASTSFECMCGFETPYGPWRESCRALARHLARCH